MFEISVLKQMKLAELQDIAKLAQIKSAGVKKELLVQQILEKQNAANASESIDKATPKEETAPKRARIVPSTVTDRSPKADLFSKETAKVESPVEEVVKAAPERKVIKFNKAKYESKIKIAAERKPVEEGEKEVPAPENAANESGVEEQKPIKPVHQQKINQTNLYQLYS